MTHNLGADLYSVFDQLVAAIDAAHARIDELQDELNELKTTPARQQWLDRREAAEYLRCHPSTIDDMASSGRLPKHLLGVKPLYAVADLDALLVPVEVADEEAA